MGKPLINGDQFSKQSGRTIGLNDSESHDRFPESVRRQGGIKHCDASISIYSKVRVTNADHFSSHAISNVSQFRKLCAWWCCNRVFIICREDAFMNAQHGDVRSPSKRLCNVFMSHTCGVGFSAAHYAQRTRRGSVTGSNWCDYMHV